MRGGGKGLGDERCPTYYRAAERSNFIHNLSFGPGSQFIAVKRNPNVLNTSGATTNSSSQSSGESSTSQDKGIGGPKFIALAAENSNLKNLVAEVRYKSFFSRRYGDCSTNFLYREAPPRDPTPYHFVYHFDRKGTSFTCFHNRPVL